MNYDHTDAQQLARDILHHSRRRITHMAPILLECIYALPEKVRTTPGPLSTDGMALWFHPEQVIEDFRKDRDYVARQLLHVTLHCLLGHLELRSEFKKKEIFDCVSDLKVAEFIRGVCKNSFATVNGEPHGVFPFLTYLSSLYDNLTVNKDYTFFRAGKQSRLDDHSLWHPPAVCMEVGAQTPENDSAEEQSDSNNKFGKSISQTAPDWDKIRSSMMNECDVQIFGTTVGELFNNFSPQERGLSYHEFLKQFAAPAERMILDPDSFDVRWYHIGLENYGNVPLLEPSELSEPPAPDDIVIALDTSGSCSGEICKRFLKETLGILQDISAGCSRFRVLFLQCDTEIQQELLLETTQQIDELFQSFNVKGFGGTDFRPVFERVEQLRDNGTFPRVRVLLYLSDGYGQFPSHPTDYPTVFLIPANETISRRLLEADWVTKLYLNEHDFTLKEDNSI